MIHMVVLVFYHNMDIKTCNKDIKTSKRDEKD